ncbi:MAG: DNA alkylation repair protein [Pseudomonadota bacterium]
MEPERKKFKEYFDREAAKALATQIIRVYAKFPKKKFIDACLLDLSAKEFNARVAQFSQALKISLPNDIPTALEILRESLPAPLPNCDAVMDGWLQWPLGQFIADEGVEYFDESMLTMTELTQRFSSEFAVRPFVDMRQQETIKYLRDLTGHDSPHVRRWCSEGLRTRLPWGKKLTGLIENPKPVIPILDALKDDEEEYVRRSVANNLNDLSKDHPALVVDKCSKWYRGQNPKRVKLVKQALRGLLKDGDVSALAVLGFGNVSDLKVGLSATPSTIKLGSAVTLNAEIESQSARDQELLIDFIVHYVRKNGSKSPKVFKWKVATLGSKETLTLQKKVAFKKTTVRELYSGKHMIELQINGRQVGKAEILLKR